MLVDLLRRWEGGMRSAGKTPGSASPAFTLSVKCIARTNSSQESLPSPSMSDSDLQINYRLKKKVV